MYKAVSGSKPLIISALLYFIVITTYVAFYLPWTPFPCFSIGDCTPPYIDIFSMICLGTALLLSLLGSVSVLFTSCSTGLRLILLSIVSTLIGICLVTVHYLPFSPIRCQGETTMSGSCTGPLADRLIAFVFIVAVALLLVSLTWYMKSVMIGWAKKCRT